MDIDTRLYTVTETGCWEWKGGRYPRGYGYVRSSDVDVFTDNIPAHRWAWSHANGRPVPDWAYVCHSCDNPPCINPEHLFIGTPAENFHDAMKKGRARFVPKKDDTDRCSRGHEPDWSRNGKKGRVCRECNRENQREWQKKKRAEMWRNWAQSHVPTRKP